ncbi:efflux RND transporter periplasmic adaptor subunit [Alteromonas sp. a30]|uniref:efflux RND transporter periplasmic adaptor subunit n=1 Tax=Alteromonas sp. a30 TaxID=2730917 RepID=UPI0022815450|nr:HlyD family efflux transporter periplasmic adaptor subunit [Alteromonas sp. a30]MCY7296887.1 HlyD family efflux transporter periplasmic adaptor subunit [Alteromonas sp. a30]
MDIKATIQSGNRQQRNKKQLIIVAVVIALLVIWQGLSFSSTQVEVSPDDMWIAEVERGELVVEIHGFGKLRSKHQRFLTSPAEATVEEIFYQPGSAVTQDALLMRLVNPEMQKEVAKEKLELDKFKADLQEKRIAQQREYLSQESKLFDLNTELEKLEIREIAERDLIKTGAISNIDYQQTKLSIRQIKNQIEVETRFLGKLGQMHKESHQAQQALLEQMQVNYAAQQRSADRLNVRAGIDGVLQELSVKLGQSTSAGGQLAMVGSAQSLIAELRVPQRGASDIKLGDPASIDTFGGQASGVVSRIDPIVSDGRILIEIEITSALPDNARPELSIEGKVKIATLTDVMYLPQPANVNGNSTAQLYKLDEDGSSASKSLVNFGQVAGRLIEIKSGATQGDRFVVSDVSTLNEHSTITFSKPWKGR